MKTSRSRVGVAVVNGLLYAIGGYDGQSRLSTVEVYNPETDSWTRVSSMNSQRRFIQPPCPSVMRPVHSITAVWRPPQRHGDGGHRWTRLRVRRLRREILPELGGVLRS